MSTQFEAKGINNDCMVESTYSAKDPKPLNTVDLREIATGIKFSKKNN